MLSSKSTLTGKFLGWQTWILLGYALLGRGFSYFGLAPLYVGEISLLFGLVSLLFNRTSGRLMNSVLPKLLMIPPAACLLLFMVWGLFCTVPYFPSYGIDAIRDAAVWYYGIFAFIVAIFLINQPTYFYTLLSRYRIFLFVFLCLTPFLWFLTNLQILPKLGGAPVPVIESKIADIMVHLSGCFAFAVSFRLPQVWLLAFLFMANLAAVGFGTNRSGAVAFAISSVLVVALHPRSKKVWVLLSVIVATVAIVLALYPEVIEPLLRKLASIISSEGSSVRDEGTKEWRIRWWTKIVNYTLNGPYFWSGRGFGINLATVDGFDPYNDGALRSPHNGHMTVLARMGVPGFCLWVATQLSWVVMNVIYYLHSRTKNYQVWPSVFVVLLVYWLAFMTTTTFEVIIEGPTGGIWIWSIFGIGLAAMWIYQKMPLVLETGPADLEWTDDDAVFAEPVPTTTSMLDGPDLSQRVESNGTDEYGINRYDVN